MATPSMMTRGARSLLQLGINPVTGHSVRGDDDGWRPASVEEACARDVLMSAQVATGGVLEVDDEAVAELRAQGMLGCLRSLTREFYGATRGTPVVLGLDAATALRSEFNMFEYARDTHAASLPALAPIHLRVATPASLRRRPALSLCRTGKDALVYVVSRGMRAADAAMLPEGVVLVSAFASDALSVELSDALSSVLSADLRSVGWRRTVYYAPLLSCQDEGVAAEGTVGWAFREMSAGRAPVMRPGREMANDLFRVGFNCSRGSEPAPSSRGERLAALQRGARATVAVMGADAYAWVWRGLLRRRCPLRSGDPEDAVQLHRRYLMLSVTARPDQVLLPTLTQVPNITNAVMVVDNRADVGVALAALCTLSHLERGRWGLVVGCTPASRGFFERVFGCATGGATGGAAEFFEVPMPSEGFSMEVYNRLMKSSAFWRSVPASHVLTVQDDGLLVRPGFDSHAGMAYDYVGAPWREDAFLRNVTRGNMVGNGGLSFRRVAEMGRVCAEAEACGESTAVYPRAPSLSVPEDVFFSSALPPGGVAPREVAAGFSAEQEWPALSSGPLGYHQFWRYFKVPFTERVFASLLPAAARRVD
jgi:hypothetical protein